MCWAQTAPSPSSSPDQNAPATNWPQPFGAGPASSGVQTPDRGYYIDPLANGSNVPLSANSRGDRFSPTIARPITTKSEFELFVEDAAGRPMAVYGRQLFDQVPTTFAPMDRVPVPANYVLGAGDELLIRVWGKVELQARVSVDRNGQIFVPKIGTLTVAGIRYDQLESYIHSAIANLYRDFELNVTMGQLRSIQIFVLGNARQPGVYTVSSLSTLVTALFASGGPSPSGSMRRIELRRGSQVVTEFDVYDMLRNGDKSHDAQLLAGDVIYIPAVGPQAGVLGSVTEPGIYELKGDADVSSVVKIAAGLSNLASLDRALLERVENHRRRQVDEFALDAAGLQRSVKDGDILRVFPISPRFENSVTLRGNVAQPGRYLWHEGMRISDLIPSRDVLLTRDYWNRQNYLASTLPPDAAASAPLLPNQQAISDSQMGAEPAMYPGPESQQADANQAYLNPTGGGVQPGNARRLNGQGDASRTGERWDRPKPATSLQSRDVMLDVEQAGAEINWQYAAIERRDDVDLTTRVVPFNLAESIDKPDSADNHVLKAGDVITIFSRRDIPLPQDKHAAFVRVGGEVNAPGVYRIDPGETLRQLVERAGGLTAHSYLYASQLTRISTRLAQEQDLKLSTAQMQRELAGRYVSAKSLAPTNAAEQQAELSSQQAIIDQLASVHPTGRIVLDMKPRAEGVRDIPEFPLEDGDSYYIPARLGTVQVSGAVYNQNAFRYQEQAKLAQYLNAAGGPTRQADTRRIFLIRADGTVVSRQNQGSFWGDSFESLRLLPGDAIVVPTKLRSPNNFMQQLPLITQILSSAATTGAIIGTR